MEPSGHGFLRREFEAYEAPNEAPDVMLCLESPCEGASAQNPRGMYLPDWSPPAGQADRQDFEFSPRRIASCDSSRTRSGRPNNRSDHQSQSQID